MSLGRRQFPRIYFHFGGCKRGREEGQGRGAGGASEGLVGAAAAVAAEAAAARVKLPMLPENFRSLDSGVWEREWRREGKRGEEVEGQGWMA